MKITMQATLSHEDIAEAVAAYVSKDTKAEVKAEHVTLTDDGATVDLGGDASASAPKKRAPRKAAAKPASKEVEASEPEAETKADEPVAKAEKAPAPIDFGTPAPKAEEEKVEAAKAPVTPAGEIFKFG